RQTEMKFATWGGKRKGAGRKPKGEKAGVAHRARPVIRRRTPVHVTLRMERHVYSLRSRRSLRVMETALRSSAVKFDVQVVQFSIQGNHIHLLVEAADAVALGRAMKGLSVRIAKGMNALMAKSGRVLADRYHARLLRTPTEVRNAMQYVRENYRHHHG